MEEPWSSWKGRVKAQRCLRLQWPTQSFALHSATSPWELGEAWDLAPSLRHSGEHVHFGMYFTASKGFPETLHWVFIPWQTGLAVGAACLLLVWWRLNSPGPNGDSFGNRSAALNPSYLCSERMN